MGLGNSFASFVNGFAGGVDTRHRWEDRRAAQERQKVLDGYEAERQKRLAEQHGWAGEQQGWAKDRHGVFMDQSADANRIRDQEWGDFQSTRSALDAAVGAADAGLGAPPPPDSPGVMTLLPTEGAAPGPVERAAATGYGIQPGAAKGTHPLIVETPGYGIAPGKAPGQAAVAPAPVQRAPTDGLGAAPADTPLLGDAGDGKVVALRAPRDAAEKKALAEAAVAKRLIQGDEAAARQTRIDAAGNARLQEGGVAHALRLDEGHEWGLPGNAGADIREGAKTVARGAVTVADTAANMGLKGVRQVNGPVNAITRWITGKDFGQPENVDTLNRNAPDFPTPKVKENEVAAGAAQVAEAVTATPAGAAAAAAVPDLGAKPGQSFTPAQIDKGATTWMQSYRDNGLPVITKELMRQGKFEAAESLRTFVNDAAAQDGMKAWSGAVFAAMSGDIDTAADLMIDAYNANGYFDDGYQIDKAQTQLIKADDGEVMGVRLAMVNQQTGETVVQEAEISDLIQRGLWLLSPEKAAEQYLARQQALKDRLIELDAERRKAGVDLIKQDNAAALRVAEDAYKKLTDPLTAPRDEKGQPLPPPTWDEFLAERFGQGAPADVEPVPMLRAPQR